MRTVRQLPSERDVNVLLDGRYVLKVSNPAEDPAVVDMENAAMSHVARVAPGLPLPSVIPAVSGVSVIRVIDDTGAACLARLITVVPGSPAEGRPSPLELAGQVGALAARTSVALQGLFHRQATASWTGTSAVLTRARRAGRSRQPRRARPSGRRADAAPGRRGRGHRRFAAGLNHADVTLTNILTGTGPDATAITGLIDFGDMHHTAHVCDLAVTLTAVMRNTAGEQPAGTWDLAAAVLAGYQRHRPLTPQEVGVLGDLIIGRLALTLVISPRRAAGHEDNQAYISQYDTSTRHLLGELLDLGPGEVTRRLHTLAGTGRVTRSGAEPADLLRRRRRVTGGALSPLFYSRPLHIVRGEGPWLFAADGTRYLDAYNNVAVVGHAHPTVTQAVSRQLARPQHPLPVPAPRHRRARRATARDHARASWTRACSPPPAPRPTSSPGGWPPPTPAATPPSSPSTPTTGRPNGWPT